MTCTHPTPLPAPRSPAPAPCYGGGGQQLDGGPLETRASHAGLGSTAPLYACTRSAQHPCPLACLLGLPHRHPLTNMETVGSRPDLCPTKHLRGRDAPAVHSGPTGLTTFFLTGLSGHCLLGDRLPRS